jgi:dephospho-CoA kinase
MVTVGLTGSYASGKTFVLDYLKSLGYSTFSADNVVNDLYAREEIRQNILKLLPPLQVFDRAKIASLIYNNLKWRKFLQSFIHPFVIEGLENFKKQNKDKDIIFAEIPLLFESDFDKYVDVIVVTYCSEESRLERAKSRESFNKANYNRIAEIQFPQQVKIEKADFSLDTDDELDILKIKIDQLIKEINSEFKRDSIRH